jgi:hypothetical protein
VERQQIIIKQSCRSTHSREGVVVDDDIASLLGASYQDWRGSYGEIEPKQSLDAFCALMGSRWLDHEGTRRRGEFVDLPNPEPSGGLERLQERE